MWTRLRASVSRLRFAWTRRRLDADSRREMDAHLELLTDRYISQGMSAGEAYTAARRQFGNPSVMRQDMLDMNSIGWLEQAARDLRYACRQLGRSPGFAAVVVTTLGVGIGGTTAVFSVVQAVLVTPLPYEQPGQLVRFFQQEPGRPDTRDVLAGTHFTFLREHAGVVRGRRGACPLLRDGPRPGHRWPCRAASRAAGVERLLQHAPLVTQPWPCLRPRR